MEMAHSSEPESEESSETMGSIIEHLEPDFQRAVEKIAASHNLAKSELNKFAHDRLKKMRRKFEVASRVSSSNSDEDPEVKLFVLNSMFETISKTAEESDGFGKDLIRSNRAVAFQTISDLSKKIRSSFREQPAVEQLVKSPSRKEEASDLKFYLRMILLVLIYVLFALISDNIVEIYKNNNMQPPTIYHSALLMGITFVLFYLKQFQ